MFEIKHVKRFEYDIEEAVWDDQRLIKDATKLVIYPIEAGNLFQIENKDGSALVSTSSSSGTSHTVGNIVFINDGQPIITFRGITDPSGLARIAKAAMKDIKYAYAEYDKTRKQAEKVSLKENNTTQADSEQSVVVCPVCKNPISKGSKFCNNCGANLQSLCSKCGYNNQEGAKFCSNCGLALS